MRREEGWKCGGTVIFNRKVREGLEEKVTMSKDLKEEREECRGPQAWKASRPCHMPYCLGLCVRGLP